MPRALLVRDPRYPIGGFETWVETLAGLLPSRGIEVLVLTPASDDPAHEILEDLGRRAASGEHGVFFTGGYAYLNVVGINLISSPWVPIPVLHGHDPGAVEWFAVGPPRRIVAPSPDVAEAFRQQLVERVGRIRAARRIRIIPHGVSGGQAILPVPPVVPPAHRGDRQTTRVVVVSRFEEDVKRASDYVRIVEAAAHLPLQFTFVGDGSALPSMRERLGGRARFTGALPRERVVEELQNADVLLSASSSEAFGLSVAEALASGCHVIAADAGRSFRQLVEEGGGTVVPVGDIDRFVRELATPRRRPNERGRELIRTRYSAESMADSYAALIRTLPSRPNPTWRPPMHRTPADALPRTLPARTANWLRAIKEAIS